MIKKPRRKISYFLCFLFLLSFFYVPQTAFAAEDDASLTDITLDGSTISGFDSGVYPYDINVGWATNEITIAAVPGEAAATVTGDTGLKPLNVGLNTYTITCTSVDTANQLTYTLNITRQAAGTDASLSDISAGGQTVPGFSSDAYTYNFAIAYSVEQINLGATATDTNAQITGDTGTQTLSVGINTLTITCTAEDEVTSQEYVLNITREAAGTDASLSDITAGGQTVPGFTSDIYTYNFEIAYSVEQIELGATATDANAQITGDTGTQTLSVGVNTFTIRCTAEDGATTQDYVLNITREAAGGSRDIVTTSEGIVFDTATGTITGYTGTASEVVIPSTINGVSVENIGYQAFYERSNLTAITIPNSVKTIGGYAFGRTGLIDVYIPDSVTSIESRAFCFCNNLVAVEIGDGLSYLGDLFYNSNNLSNLDIGKLVSSIDMRTVIRQSLESITVDQDNTVYKSLDGVLLSKDGSTLYIYPSNKYSTNYVLPDTVRIIEEGAFAWANIDAVVLPENLVEIKALAFSDSKITEITIPDSVTSIGESAFYLCEDLSDLIIGNGIATINFRTFGKCKSLVEVVIPRSVSRILDAAFLECSGMLNIVIPETVIEIDIRAFMNHNVGLTIYGSYYSYAQTYAELIDVPFISMENTDATLSDLSVDGATITGFERDRYIYHISFDSLKASVDLGAVVSDANAQLSGDIGIQNLLEGLNTFTITCTAANGITQKDYIIYVSKVASLTANAFSNLGFTPFDMAIDPDREVAYMTEADGYRLYRLDLATGQVKYMEFVFKAERLTVNNGKVYLTLLHRYHDSSPPFELGEGSGTIVVIDTATYTIINTFDVVVDPYDIEVDDQGIAYIGPGSGQISIVVSYNTNTTECLSVTDGVRHLSKWNYNEQYNKLYSITADISVRNIYAYELANGVISTPYCSPYHGQYSMSTYMRISPDGQYIFNGSGNIFTCAPTQTGDMIYDGNINAFTSICFDIDNNEFYTASGNVLNIYNYNLRTLESQFTAEDQFIQIFYKDDQLIFLQQKSNGDYYIDFGTPTSFDTATLSDITIDGTTITGFAGHTYTYDIIVENATAQIVIGATPTNDNAQVTGDTGTQNLTVGSNTFTITCTAQDGITTQDYTLNITRRSPEKVALLFGMADYVGTENDLPGPVNDMIAMQAVLEHAGYTVHKYMNYSASNVLSTIEATASGLAACDTLLFAYSGHGSDGGYLVGADAGFISIDELESKLSLHSGVKEVLIDACYSGDFIGKGVISKFFVKLDSSEAFNNYVVSVFKNSDAGMKTRNLAESGYYVITACSGSQLSYEFAFSIPNSPFAANNLVSTLYEGETYYWLGYFNCAFHDGFGLYNSTAFSDLWADANLDEIITWNEIYQYAASVTNDEQQSQVYPENSTHVLYDGSGGGSSEELQSLVYTLDQGNGVVLGVADETPLASFIGNFSNDAAQIKVFDAEGVEVTSGYAGTGMTVRLIVDGITEDLLYICVLGDNNGDGLIDIIDYTYVRLDIFGLRPLTGVYFTASDVDTNGIIDIIDYTYIRLDIFGLRNIN